MNILLSFLSGDHVLPVDLRPLINVLPKNLSTTFLNIGNKGYIFFVFHCMVLRTFLIWDDDAF